MRVTVLLVSLLIASCICASSGLAGHPENAQYTDDASKIFWFVHASDLHIGMDGDWDSERLDWLTSEAFDVIAPQFIVATGDLTDSTNGGSTPNGPHQEEWDEYKALLAANGMDADVYYDLPGNHDQYGDLGMVYYLNNSVQGQAEGTTQHSWVREFNFGKYHFIGTATCGNDGWPWPFDNAGLDDGELDFIESELIKHSDANLTFAFGHHPILFFLYGGPQFSSLLENYHASVYGYGHVHEFANPSWNNGVLHYVVRSLGKSDNHHFAVYAIDNDGLSINWGNAHEWPLVVITAPVDSSLGGDNPWAYLVSSNWNQNPIRALVFDANPVTQVRFRLADGQWMPMTQEDSHLWVGTFDGKALEPWKIKLEVQATGSATNSHIIYFLLGTTICDDGIDNDGDTLIDYPADPGCVSPSDMDEYNPNHPPVADAGEDQSVSADQSVTLDGSASYDPDGQTLTYSWDFDASDGIGKDATGATVETTYNKVGDYVVTLTVDDGLGLTASDTATVHVLEGEGDDDSGSEGGCGC